MEHDEVEGRQFLVEQPFEGRLVKLDVPNVERARIPATAFDVLRVEVARVELAARKRAGIDDRGMSEAGAQFEISECRIQ